MSPDHHREISSHRPVLPVVAASPPTALFLLKEYQTGAANPTDCKRCIGYNDRVVGSAILAILPTYPAVSGSTPSRANRSVRSSSPNQAARSRCEA